MAGKLKGFNIKRLFVDHGEKLAFVIVLGMVVAGLAGTNWVPYQKQPSEFTAKVDSAVKNIAATTWSQEEQEQFILQEEEAPHRIVDRGINDRIAVTPFYVQSQPQLKDKDARDDPLQEPQFLPVVQLMASDARVLVRQTPDLDDGLVAAVDGADRGVPDDDATGPGGFPSGAAEERPDEFLGGGRGGAGYGGSLIDDDGPGRGGSGPGFGRGGGRDYVSMNAPELNRNSRGWQGQRLAGRGDRRAAVLAGGSRATKNFARSMMTAPAPADAAAAAGVIAVAAAAPAIETAPGATTSPMTTTATAHGVGTPATVPPPRSPVRQLTARGTRSSPCGACLSFVSRSGCIPTRSTRTTTKRSSTS